jgi:hypothetical protein
MGIVLEGLDFTLSYLTVCCMVLLRFLGPLCRMDRSVHLLGWTAAPLGKGGPSHHSHMQNAYTVVQHCTALQYSQQQCYRFEERQNFERFKLPFSLILCGAESSQNLVWPSSQLQSFAVVQ